MKISTITCHDVYNYGASLQAYALQEFCKSLGHEYQIIDYKPPYLSQHYKLNIVANPKYDKPIIKQLYLLAKLPGRLRGLKRKRLFDKFTADYLSLSVKQYNSIEELVNDPPASDIYIAGSDQIWNTLFNNGRDAAFYLDFVDRSKRKISYAASFATEKIHNGATEFVREKLKNLDAISVRETSALSLLESLGYQNGVLVCDPVFLLSAEEWSSLIDNNTTDTHERAIVVYDCEKSELLKDIACAQQWGETFPIYSLASAFDRYYDKNFSLSGPIEFLKYIRNAHIVLANSFHALAFALIFQRDFIITARSESLNSRMKNFLEYLGLEYLYVSNWGDYENIQDDIHSKPSVDWASVTPKIEALVKSSKAYLKEQLSLCK